jgi:hypothetical protein
MVAALTPINDNVRALHGVIEMATEQSATGSQGDDG